MDRDPTLPIAATLIALAAATLLWGPAAQAAGGPPGAPPRIADARDSGDARPGPAPAVTGPATR